ncbi:MAG TPA: acetolactate synthase small subunit [Dehalococcoidia bacterium]|nr:acetolactate synthase small subunit [Dehalococcoidia bacterium]
MAPTKHILIALVEDKPGVLNRMASLFRRRSFNIESIAVGRSEVPNISRTTIVVDGTTTSVEQVRKQLDKVVDVVRVVELSDEDTISRELALVKVKSSSTTRSEIMQIVDIFRANIVDVGSDSLTVEVTGDENKINSLLTLLQGFGIRELARTGRIAMTRGLLSPLQIEKDVQSTRTNKKKE